jgi:hypothetical protein
MSSFKKLNKADVTTVDYTANKRWNLFYTCPSISNGYFNIYKGTNIDGVFYPDDPSIDPVTNNQYERLIFDSMNHLFYQSYSGSLLDTGSLMFNINTYESASQQRPTSSYFNYNSNPLLIKRFPTGSGNGIRVISVDPDVYGAKLLPHSINLSSSAYNIKDDGYGNLYDISGVGDDYIDLSYLTVATVNGYFDDLTPGQGIQFIGNVFYAHGLMVITNPDYQNIFPLPPLALNDLYSFDQYDSPKSMSILSNDIARTGILDTGSVVLYGSNSPFYTINANGTVTLTTTTPGNYNIYYTVNSLYGNGCSLTSNKAKINAIVTPSPFTCFYYLLEANASPTVFSFNECSTASPTTMTLNDKTIGYVCAEQNSVTVTPESGVITLIGNCPDRMTIQASNLNSFTASFTFNNTGYMTVYWGDGTADSVPYSSNTQLPAHTYGSAYNGDIIIEATDLSHITTFNILTTYTNPSSPIPLAIAGSEFAKLDGLVNVNIRNATVTATIPQLAPTIQNLEIWPANISGTTTQIGSHFTNNMNKIFLLELTNISGDIDNLPSTLTNVQIYGNNTLTGDIANIPPNCILFAVIGKNTLSGSLKNLPNPSFLTTFNVQGLNTISGDIATFPTSSQLTLLSITGDSGSGYNGNTISGSIDNCTWNAGLQVFQIKGSNTISGNIATLSPCTSLQQLIVTGENVSIPSAGNTLSGSLASLSSSLNIVSISGKNTISGTLANISSLTNLTYFELSGLNTISGDVKDIPTSVSYINIQGNNTINTYSATRAFPGTMYNLRITPTVFPTTDLDRLLTDTSGSNWAAYPDKLPNLILKGTYTATAAYNTLSSKITLAGGTISITP